jgi:flagellar M-ring protein FliF
LKEFLTSLDRRSRRGLAIGVGVVVVAAIVAAAWLLRTDYQVLFADLKPQDAAQMTAELDRQKVGYRLSDDSTTILVDANIVHATRLKLMGKDLPLHGAAGFELFNNGDFGMTEFAQKINYQRALQGEITRTILALSEVREARVHLALPEDGLFKRSNSKPKAAITLSLKAGQSLRPEQVSGIQRLVAAAVPGILAQDVTIVDQQGVALTRAVLADGEAESGTSGRLDLKRDMEKLLARKATEVLERAFGAGQALTTVDVTLNMDQVRVTTEDVIGTPGQAGQAPAGVMVRQREVLRDVGAPLGGQQDSGSHASNTQREVEYQVGRRVEQVVSQPGTIRRLHVAAVVRNPLDAQQLEQARALVAAAVGGVAERGDTIVVQSLKAFDPAETKGAVPVGATAAEERRSPPPIKELAPAAQPQFASIFALSGAAALLMVAIVIAGRRLFSRDNDRLAPPLSEAERQVLVTQLKLWLEQGRLPARVASAAGAQREPEVQS